MGRLAFLALITVLAGITPPQASIFSIFEDAARVGARVGSKAAGAGERAAFRVGAAADLSYYAAFRSLSHAARSTPSWARRQLGCLSFAKVPTSSPSRNIWYSVSAALSLTPL